MHGPQSPISSFVKQYVWGVMGRCNSPITLRLSFHGGGQVSATIQVVKSLLGYRSGLHQWAWAIHRIAGLGVLLFLALHIVDIFIAAFGSEVFNNLLFLYKGPPARVMEIFLVFGLLYHAMNGLRITAADFFPRLATLEIAKHLFYIQMILFMALFVPASYYMMWTLPGAPFHHNAAIALLTTSAILVLPIAIIWGARLPALANLWAARVSETNIEETLFKPPPGSQTRAGGRTEYNIWLFMRVSGILLIMLALLHLYIMHITINVEDIDFNTIVQRWNDPARPLISLFWRAYDLALLVFAYTHGMLGTNYSVRDYIHAPRWQRIAQIGLFILWIVLTILGAWIIFFFQGSIA